ncbi:MAG: hypothetical protein SPG84_01025 [Vescimonas sp.]|uniref:hypothetical protein n=1 Tax=Vescimonas sp. TaxID=2892404 RepID=UPI002A915573|nr:hypothetical protein [Vescimonas sp.]MDY5333469.1 hypothetical protein [Vescimonas sp.]
MTGAKEGEKRREIKKRGTALPSRQLVKKVRSDFFDKLAAKSQNKKQYFILRFWSLRRVIEREREP